MDLVAQYQRQLLEQTQYIYYETPISEATQHAFRHMPRHRFIQRYRDWGTTEWHEVRADNVGEHLATLYANRALTLFGNDDDHIPSTISQPSLVLRMLDMLQLQPGHTVFELGAGSGWNAALMGYLVSPTGPSTVSKSSRKWLREPRRPLRRWGSRMCISWPLMAARAMRQERRMIV